MPHKSQLINHNMFESLEKLIVGQYEELVMGTIPDGVCQTAFQFLAKDYFLFTHLVNYKLRITNY